MKRTMITALSVVVLVFGVIGYASAVTGDTTVSANVKGVLELTAPGSVSLGDLEPGVAKDSSVLSLAGKSNRDAELSASVAKGGFTTLTSTLSPVDWRGANLTANDTITGMVDWNVDPGAITGTVTYSLVQK